MLKCVLPINIFLFFYFLFPGKEMPAKTKLMPANLRPVLTCAECQPTLDFRNFFDKLTCGTQFFIDICFSKNVRFFAVFAFTESDSVQCQPAWGHLFRKYCISAKTNLSANPFLPVNQGPNGKNPKNLVTLPL